MTAQIDIQLKNKDIFPTREVLQNVLGDSFPVLDKLMDIFAHSDFSLVPEWNYYKDGKAWLCKISHKKKTVCWLSVWDKFFKVGFYFTAKNCHAIEGLDIDEQIREDFARSKSIGKLMPLVVNVRKMEQIADVTRIILLKRSLK